MKKILLTTVLLATLTAVNAQESKDAEMDKATIEQAAAAHQQWADQYGLDPKQAELTRPVMDRFNAQMKELKSADLEGEAADARSQILMDMRDKDLEQILNKEQFVQFIEDSKVSEKRAEPKKANNSPMMRQSK
ncbi:MAG: hypothetical protein IPH05_13795 [Flavobacteriales bacterium]|jgi:hypothetical protein|nr:hypothetical protein [Flavobacteriales bacterium]MBK6549429.1 hypothetical protein [Flavobacteriales bacterium]MBK6883985.1 hypothetical protein [Flavobacteriales bacterium]MBK7100374.1 hypothetical protein [Flavobacteriales bacterium]MBK7111068.1 hypothetical protein [Flavobacteriales bacterium]